MSDVHAVNARPGRWSVPRSFGVIGGPAAWALGHVVGYAWTQKVCGSGDATGRAVMVAITVTFAALALVAAFISWRAWRRNGGDSPEQTDGGPVARERFCGALGLMLALLSAVVIVAQGIGTFFFDGCWN
jgi:hypothetical protein